MKKLCMLLILSLVAIAPMAPAKKPPAPEKKDLTMTELNGQLVDLNQKVVETKINWVTNFEQVDGNRYRATCYHEIGRSTGSGGLVLIPKEGKDFFEDLAKRGYGASTKTVYLRVHNKPTIRANKWTYKFEAIGTRYRKKTNEYKW